MVKIIELYSDPSEAYKNFAPMAAPFEDSDSARYIPETVINHGERVPSGYQIIDRTADGIVIAEIQPPRL